MADPSAKPCPPAPAGTAQQADAGQVSGASLAGDRALALIRAAANLLRLAGSQCCTARSQAAWDRIRERDAAVDQADTAGGRERAGAGTG